MRKLLNCQYRHASHYVYASLILAKVKNFFLPMFYCYVFFIVEATLLAPKTVISQFFFFFCIFVFNAPFIIYIYFERERLEILQKQEYLVLKRRCLKYS